MKSELLESAIIDAEALKEAALKSAQKAVLDKYAPQVKKAIQIILEQDNAPESDDPLSDLNTDSIPEMGGGMGGNPDGGPDLTAQAPEVEGPDLTGSISESPLAAIEGDKLCACPDEDEEIEINFDELEKQMQSKAAEDNIPDSMPGNEEEEPDLNLQIKESMDDENQETSGLSESEIDEELSNFMFEDETSEESVKVESKVEDIKEKDKKINENRVFSENSSLVKENKQLTKVKKDLIEENKKHKLIITNLTERIEQVNFSNAKLYYTNQALSSTSLNERQKNNIVEAITKAKSVEDVKLVYETLQMSVGSTIKNKDPKSLNEAVVNKGGTMFPRRNTGSDNPVYDRMQKIAGIKK